MVMLGLMEIYQLLFFSGIGVLIYYSLVQEASSQIRLDVILPTVFAIAICYLPIHILFFKGVFGEFSKIRDAQIFRAFRQARPIHYLLLLLFKAPNLLGAVMVYTFALQLFNVDVGFGQMLAFLPVIFLAAALPLPFHAGALLLWTVLFPEFPEVGVFSLIMHTFFVLFNAAIGVVFLPKANAELFDQAKVKSSQCASQRRTMICRKRSTIEMSVLTSNSHAAAPRALCKVPSSSCSMGGRAGLSRVVLKSAW